jgi:HlyD family secretion protein
MMLFLHGYFSFWYKWKKGSTQAELVKLAPRIKHMDASGVQHKEIGKKTITPVRLTAAGFIAIAFLTFGIFPNPVSSDGLLASTAHAESKLDALIDPKIREWLDRLHKGEMPEGIAKTNGRIEATQIDVSSKYAGRLENVNVNEGDEVTAGQEVAHISSPETEAQLRGAQAQELAAKQALAEAEALIAQRKSDLEFANNDVARGKPLVEKGYMTKQVFDQRVTKAEVAEAALHAAEAQHEAAQSQIKNAQAEVERIEAILVDLTLVSPRSGRVQYLIHRAGEVVDAGTRILTILDLNDVYMTIYLPAAQAGKLALGDEARMILDPFPQYVVPATVSFVATEAQFTPKSVETAEEREKLIFRVKLQVDPKVLGKYHTEVKTGVRGMGFVRTDTAVSWPEDLAVKLP